MHHYTYFLGLRGFAYKWLVYTFLFGTAPFIPIWISLLVGARNLAPILMTILLHGTRNDRLGTASGSYFAG